MLDILMWSRLLVDGRGGVFGCRALAGVVVMLARLNKSQSARASVAN